MDEYYRDLLDYLGSKGTINDLIDAILQEEATCED